MDFSLRPCKTRKLCLGRKLSKKDRISGLPDDILVLVLSLLTMKEAGRTSLLSKRWRHVWAHVPLLNFDGSKILDELEDDYVSVEVESSKFLRWVDQVVSLHKASTVDEFRVRYYLKDTSSDNIDKWLRFALEKRVKRLDLDFGYYDETGGFSLYDFPDSSFFISLTSLQLAFVNVVGEVLESLIYNCKALEVLSVISSNVLVDLKVVGPSLKSLRISRCTELINMEVFAPNLVCMDYNGGELCMPFKSTPKLAELAIGGHDKPHLMMTRINHQIEVLNLNVPRIQSELFPNCTRLKMMYIDCYPKCDEDLYGISSLINACPLLQKLVVQLHLCLFESYNKKWKSRGEEPWWHYHLKIVEIVGFSGSILRFARHLVKNIVSLEKVIIDTQPPFSVRMPGEPEVGETITKALNKAELLRAHLKPGTEIEIR